MKFVNLLSAAVLLSACAVHAAPDPFEDVIRKTDALTPEQEQKSFHLPPGWEIQLVASEPMIGKPMNMTFDAKGRLLVTLSREYPFPVLPVEKPGRDRVVVLEDFDVDGHARKSSTFVDGLNIPIGLLPYKDGVIAFSIPKIHFFEDTDGDGKSDKDEVLLSGFGYERDTHGLTSNFKRGYDGWIYADHGFNNNSTVVAKDGSSIFMNSGNCYRFKPDGSHVEQFSWGQVNPFGLMFDPLGDLWSADCHSLPTYILLHGGYISSFGKPNDGLGFSPEICKHQHGSTAICGMIFGASDTFPPDLQGNTLIGNVMTCRINRDSYPEFGSTRIAKEEPDFLSSDDPWFRPNNMELGPDGAIYVTDFYNRIIGHYEVPLTNPLRDRVSGRIWRIVYKGPNAKPVSNMKDYNISKAGAEELIMELANGNITRRMLAMNELVDRIGEPAIKPVTKMMKDKKSGAFQKLHGLWVLHRLNGLEPGILTAAAKDSDRLVRVHAMRVLAEIEKWTSAQHALALHGLQDSDAYVQRSAADAVGRHADYDNIKPLLALRASAPAKDEELIYVTRMALRNQLIPAENFIKLQKAVLTEAQTNFIADVALGVKSEQAGNFLLQCVQQETKTSARMEANLRHVARYCPSEGLDVLAKFVQTKFAADLDFQLTLFKSVQEGVAERGGTLSAGMTEWGANLCEKMLVSVNEKTLEWHNTPLPRQEPNNPWFVETRLSSDGQKAKFLTSLSPGGERLTGSLKSHVFTIPAELSFYLAGHDGPPDQPMRKKNFIRLRDAKTHQELISTQPPRNDVAQPVKWDLSKFAGRKGLIEIIDGNNGGAYAWLAAGRFDPPVVAIPKVIPSEVDQRQKAAAEIAGSLKLAKPEPLLVSLLKSKSAAEETRIAAAKSLMQINPSAHVADLVKVLSNPAESAKLREQCALALGGNSAESQQALIAALPNSTQSLQTQIGLALASSAEGAEAFLEAVANGKASARLLQDRNIKDRLVTAKPANLDARLAQLTKGLPAPDIERQKLIDARSSGFRPSQASPVAGAEVFKKNCMVCHSLDGQGAVIGPQLDGVGGRGAERITEDIFDPSRNVDKAFRVTLFTMKDGDIQSGLFRREEGEMVVIANSAGKEISIPKKEIAERKESELSLMPDNFAQALSNEDFYNLLSYLMSKGPKAGKK